MELIEKIRTKIIESGVDDRYKSGAYMFVLSALNFYHAKIGEKRRANGHELSFGLLLFAEKQFGPMAQSVFDHWGIKNTEDLGCILYNMINIGMLDKQSYDSLDSFYSIIDIRTVFDGAEKFEIDKEFIRKK